ncbi:MAG TPA: ATP-binding protein [Chloroflexia bacterium]|nr:ATP-binding protein [Chloroflexia bacterium]
MRTDQLDEAVYQTPAFNDVEIHIPSDLVFERVVRESAVVVAKYLGFDDDRVADLQLAVSEAVTNAIEHGNNCDINVKVGVKFFIHSGSLAVKVTDRGQWGSANNAVENTPDTWNLEDRLEQDLTRGMGIFLIQNLVDNVDVRSNSDGTEFTMWFNLKKGPDNPVLNIELEGPEKS